LKKRTKKLLLIEGLGNADATSRRTRSFLVVFFKKEPLALPYLTAGLYSAIRQRRI
jgi:hypothetical protein